MKRSTKPHIRKMGARWYVLSGREPGAHAMDVKVYFSSLWAARPWCRAPK